MAPCSVPDEPPFPFGVPDEVGPFPPLSDPELSLPSSSFPLESGLQAATAPARRKRTEASRAREYVEDRIPEAYLARHA